MKTVKTRQKHRANKRKGGPDRARNANKATKPTKMQWGCVMFKFVLLFYGLTEP